MIYYCFRNTLDYKKKKPLKNYGWGQLPVYTAYVKHWNKTLPIDWYEFRDRLKDISKLSYKLSDIEEIECKDWRDLADDDWLLPTDDDDWVNPDFQNDFSDIDADFAFGNPLFYNIHTGYNSTHKNQVSMPSCGYAVRIRALKSVSKRSADNLIKRHWLLRPEVMENNISFYYTGGISACYVRHTGTVSGMSQKKALEAFIENSRINFKTVEKSLKWMEPFLEELKKLFNDFKIQRKISQMKLL